MAAITAAKTPTMIKKKSNKDSEGNMRKSVKYLLAISGVALVSTCAFGLFGPAEVAAESTALAFSADNWTVKSGNVELTGQNAITTNKDTDVGDNKLLISTKQEYSDFHLQFKVQYDSGNTHGDPWNGYGGVLIHGDKDAAVPDGYYMGFYGWDLSIDATAGASLLESTGWWWNGAFHRMNGTDCAFGAGGNGFKQYTIDIYVKDSHVNTIIDGWLFQNAPLPYTTSGVISIYNDGLSCKYSDISVESLGADFDITSTLIRANWGGGNTAGEMWYWNDAGKDHSFRMKLADESEGATNYYLARLSKVSDGNQTVDVHVDKTGALEFADKDGWAATEKFTWGDKTGVGSGVIFSINSVEIPSILLDGVAPSSNVGFYIDKNIEGWYSAQEYWLLYKDKNGVLRVADHIDPVYAFDRDAHAFAHDQANSYIRGYSFISQDNELITSHRRGQEVAWLKPVTLTKKGDIEHTFEFTDPALDVDISEYADIQTNHFKCKIEYSVDGGEYTDKLVLPAATASGKITVRVSTAGVANDASGAISFAPLTTEISYTTTRNAPATYFRKIKDINVNSVGDGTKIDLKDYVETNIDGAWSYVYDGNTVQGSAFTLPAETVSGKTVTVSVTPDGGEKSSADITLDVKYYAYPTAVKFPYYNDCGAPGDEWMPLYGTVKADGGKWTSAKNDGWGVMADFGTDSYVFRTRLDVKETEQSKQNDGILIHASVGTHGCNGLLLQFRNVGNTPYITAGWLFDGKFVLLQDFYAGFNMTGDFYLTVISSGSSVEIMLNGWRVCNIVDRYYGGGKLALLGASANVWSDMRCDAFTDNIADRVIRRDWQIVGADTFAKEAIFSGAFSVTFDLPSVEGITGYKLVTRTFRNDKSVNIAAGDKNYTLNVTAGDQYGDAVLELTGLQPTGDELTLNFTHSISAGFDASFMTLLYTAGGVDYIADSVYFGNPDDAKAHGVTPTSFNDRKMYIPLVNGQLLTGRKGEKAVWARGDNVSDAMEAKTYSDATVSSSVDLPYRLYLPQGYDESKQYPVMLFLHGAGERGSDNVIHVNKIAGVSNVLLDRLVLGGYNDKFIVVAPQCPEGMRWVENDWSTGKYDFDSIAQSIPSRLVSSLLHNEIFAKYSVDRSRIYGAGVSMGGFGITDLAMREPGLFAAVYNICGGCDDTKADLLSTTAIRGYHSPTDGTVNYEPLKGLIASAAGKGYDAQYSEINAGIGHLEWVPAFEEPDLITWLLAHRKTWTVSVELNGGALADGITLPQTYGYDSDTVTLPVPTRVGYAFGGWYADEKFGGEPVTSFGGKTATNLTLYAKWTTNLTVSVKVDGSDFDTVTLENGDELDLSQFKPVKTGYVLIGWTDGTNDYSVKGKVTVNANMTLTAKWQIATYTVTVYRDGGKIFEETAEYGSSVTFNAPTDDGYVFDGLYADADFTVKAELPETVTDNVTLYAKYTRKSTPEKPENKGEPKDDGVNLGLAVGLPVGLVAAVAAVTTYIAVRKKRKHSDKSESKDGE